MRNASFFFTKSPRNNFTNSSCFALGNPNFTPFESLMIIGVRKKKIKAKKHFQKVKSVIWIHTFISSACFRNNKIHGNITNWHVFDLPIYILLKKYIFHNKDLFQIKKTEYINIRQLPNILNRFCYHKIVKLNVIKVCNCTLQICLVFSRQDSFLLIELDLFDEPPQVSEVESRWRFMNKFPCNTQIVRTNYLPILTQLC